MHVENLSSNHEIIVATGPQWIGIFIDGKLIRQSHPWTFTPKYWIKMGLESHPGTVETRYVDVDWLEKRGELPVDIANVIWSGEAKQIPRPRPITRQLQLPETADESK